MAKRGFPEIEAYCRGYRLVLSASLLTGSLELSPFDSASFYEPEVIKPGDSRGPRMSRYYVFGLSLTSLPSTLTSCTCSRLSAGPFFTWPVGTSERAPSTGHSTS